MNLTLNPVPITGIPVTGAQICEAAACYEGQPFAIAGHYAFLQPGGIMRARLDCLRLVFYVWRDLHLWPVQWGRELPLVFRLMSLQTGPVLNTLDDFPLLGQLIEANFDAVDLEQRQPGDLLGFAWGIGSAPHHVGICCDSLTGSPYGAMWHCAARERVARIDLDELWRSRLRRVWRLKGIADGGING